jgi:excisionase family DNA binding protein
MKSRNAAATRVLTLGEVADYLHVSRATIYRLLKRNEIPAFKVGSDWRFNGGANRPLVRGTTN